jgi:putative hydrolase of the HAD superfamily
VSGSVEAVVFDWGGTLTPWHRIDFRDQWLSYARHHAQASGRSPEEAMELAERIMTNESAAWLRLRGDGGSARMEEILAASGIGSDDPAHSAAQAAYEEFWEPHTVTDEQVRPVWEGLRDRGVRVGVLSNTIWSRSYHDGIFARDGVLDLIDGSVYSSEIAHAKPHPEAFAAALAAVGVSNPARAVYVGDRPYEDVHGAQQAGLRAILVPHSDIPEDQQVPVDVTPDGVAHQLLDVLGLVDRWSTESAS